MPRSQSDIGSAMNNQTDDQSNDKGQLDTENIAKYIRLFEKYSEYSVDHLERMIEIGKNVLSSTEITVNNPIIQKIDEIVDVNTQIQNELQIICNNSSKKGKVGENIVYSYLSYIFPKHCLKLASKSKNQADIHINFRERLIILDVKNYNTPIPHDEILKLKRDADTTKCSIAFLISLTSKISTIEESISIEKQNDQIFVYISNIDINNIIDLIMSIIKYNDVYMNYIDEMKMKEPIDNVNVSLNINTFLTEINTAMIGYNDFSKHILNLGDTLKEMTNGYLKCQEVLKKCICNFTNSMKKYNIINIEYKEFDTMNDEEKVKFYYGTYIFTSISKYYRLLFMKIGNYLYDTTFELKVLKNEDIYELNIFKNNKMICKTDTKLNDNRFKYLYIFSNKKRYQLLSTTVDQIIDEFKNIDVTEF